VLFFVFEFWGGNGALAHLQLLAAVQRQRRDDDREPPVMQVTITIMWDASARIIGIHSFYFLLFFSLKSFSKRNRAMKELNLAY
jgi:hypothetical protein